MASDTLPAHYQIAGRNYIYAIEETLGPEGFRAFCMGNWMKYNARHKLKGGEKDLKKAAQYLEWAVNGLPPLEKDADTFVESISLRGYGKKYVEVRTGNIFEVVEVIHSQRAAKLVHGSVYAIVSLDQLPSAKWKEYKVE